MTAIVADGLHFAPMPLSFTPTVLVTALFAALLVLSLSIKFWLASRQIRHVSLHRENVPGAFADRISLSAHQKAADYTVAKARLGLLELAWGGATLLAWTLLGGLDNLNQWLLTVLGGGMWQQLALLGLFTLISGLLDLPFSLYQTFVIEQKFGFNKMTLALWLQDMLKSTLLGIVIGLPLVALILWLMAAAGSLWWLWAWSVWTAFNLLLLLIYPTFIAPIFNKFKPLEDETVKARVSALMQRCGFSAKGLFVMDGSKRSAHANAYFTGFGASKRVVFYDTLLSKLSPAEVDAVLAHELGHFKHKHVLKRMLTLFGMSLLGFALLGWLSAQAWFFQGLGVQPNAMGMPWTQGQAPTDALALLLFMLTLPVATFFMGPLLSQVSRTHEFEADSYAVQHTSANDLGSALLKMYEDNASTLTPDPVYVQVYYSHPPATERLLRMGATLG
jgi:STE24 endopeptidase